MTNRKGVVIIHTASLLILRGVERWIIEVAKRLDEPSIVITMSKGVKSHNITDVKHRIRFLREVIPNIRWFELSVVSHEDVRFARIARFMKYRGLFILRPKALTLLFKLRRYLKGFTAYLISGDALESVLLILLALLLGVRSIILGIHAEPNLKRFKIFSPAFALFSNIGILRAIHSVNRFYVALLKRVAPTLRIVYVPNGVDCEKFKPRRKKTSFQVIFVGALSFDKGADVVVEVARNIRKLYPDISFVIVSAGGPLKEVIERATGEGFVEYKGFVTDDELTQLYAESHIAFLPSRREFFGMTALEAMASGTPVVVSNTSGFRHFVKHGYSGLIIKKYSVEAFIDAILRIYRLWKSDEARYEQMMLSARILSEKFCWSNVIKLLLKLLA